MASSPPGSPAGAGDNGVGTKRRISRKLRNKAPAASSSTPELPAPLRDSDESADEEPNEALPTPMSVNMNQSIFGLIAAAGSRVDFHTRFDGNSSDEDGPSSSKASAPGTSQTTVLQPPASSKKHKKSLSKHKLFKSFATLPRLKPKSKLEPSRLSQPELSTDDNPSESSEPSETQASLSAETQVPTARRPSVMSRMLQARAEMSSRPSFDIERKSADLRRSEDADDATPLARRLMEIFEFTEPEQVIEGMILRCPPCSRQCANPR